MTDTLAKEQVTETAYESNQMPDLIGRLQISHINMFRDLKKTIIIEVKEGKNINKEIESIKKNQMVTLALKSKITKIKNSLKGFNSRFELVEERISELEVDQYRLCKQKNKEKDEENEQSFTEMWDTIKCTNIYVMGVLEGKEKKQQKK